MKKKRPGIRLLPLLLLPILLLPAAAPARLTVKPFPLANYDADLGIGYGLSTTIYSYDNTSAVSNRPYRWMIYAEYFATTGGEMEPDITVDFPDLRLGDRAFRLQGILEFKRTLFDSYYGYGNNDASLNYSVSNQENYYYNYKKTKPYLTFTLSTPVKWGRQYGFKRALELIAGASLEYYRIEHSEPEGGVRPSLLFEEQPAGINGGFLFALLAGIRYDSRDSFTAPHRGTLNELLLEFSNRTLGSSYSYTRISFKHTSFFEPVPGYRRLVFGQRILIDRLLGNAPFFKAELFGGTLPIGGIGGNDSMRGIPLYRYKGNAKIVYTPELRWDFLRFGPFLGDQWHIEAVLFSDIGSVWNDFSGFSFRSLHWTKGVALRIYWGADFCIAVDWGFWRKESALYIGFDQQF